MYSNDLHNAYTYETEHYQDMMRDAAQSRLARECKGDAKGVNASSEKHRLLVVIGVLSLVACISQTTMDPLSMVDVFHQTINGDDMHALLVLVSDDAVVIDNGLVIEGKELIRDWALHSQRMVGLRLMLLKSELDGEKVIWLDEVHKDQETGHGSYLLKWEAIIRDGKIQSIAAMPSYWPDQK